MASTAWVTASARSGTGIGDGLGDIGDGVGDMFGGIGDMFDF